VFVAITTSLLLPPLARLNDWLVHRAEWLVGMLALVLGLYLDWQGLSALGTCPAPNQGLCRLVQLGNQGKGRGRRRGGWSDTSLRARAKARARPVIRGAIRLSRWGAVRITICWIASCLVP
jgi:hypothetical protein